MACDEVACLQANSKDSQRCPEVHSSTKLQHACISTRIKRAEGVKKNDEKSGLNPGPVREGEPAKGSSTYSAAARKFARRYARDACQEMPGPIETEPMVPCAIGQMMASPQVTGPLPSGDTAAPRGNETSVFCAGAATPASSRNTKRAQKTEVSLPLGAAVSPDGKGPVTCGEAIICPIPQGTIGSVSIGPGIFWQASLAYRLANFRAAALYVELPFA